MIRGAVLALTLLAGCYRRGGDTCPRPHEVEAPPSSPRGGGCGSGR